MRSRPTTVEWEMGIGAITGLGGAAALAISGTACELGTDPDADDYLGYPRNLPPFAHWSPKWGTKLLVPRASSR